MRFKLVLTTLTAIVAVGGAFARTAGAKQLLINQGWYANPNGGGEAVATTTASAQIACGDASPDPCLYHFDEDATQPDRFITGQLDSN